MPKPESFIPALRFNALTGLYDSVIAATMRERTFKKRLINDVVIHDAQQVIDVGCGTATLTIMIRSRWPKARVVGFDPDPKALAIAQRKSAAAGLPIEFREGMAGELPFPDNSIDWLFTSMMLHHLTLDNKRKALFEFNRVLKPRGELRIADFGRPRNMLMYVASSVVRFLEEAGDNIKGMIPTLCTETGFERVEELAHYSTGFGTVTILRAIKPAGARKE